MKRLILIAALAGLAACAESEADTDADTADTETAVIDEAGTETEGAMALDGQPAPGTYRITLADGAVFMEEVKPDGTYVQTDEAGEVVQTGSWVQKSPEQFCFTVDAEYVGEDEPAGEQCNTESMNDDGDWMSTGIDGEAAKVERVEA